MAKKWNLSSFCNCSHYHYRLCDTNNICNKETHTVSNSAFQGSGKGSNNDAVAASGTTVGMYAYCVTALQTNFFALNVYRLSYF